MEASYCDKWYSFNKSYGKSSSSLDNRTLPQRYIDIIKGRTPRIENKMPRIKPLKIK
jgi:uncharacterized FAD-dependent dehydrogenase